MTSVFEAEVMATRCRYMEYEINLLTNPRIENAGTKLECNQDSVQHPERYPINQLEAIIAVQTGCFNSWGYDEVEQRTTLRQYHRGLDLTRTHLALANTGNDKGSPLKVQ